MADQIVFNDSLNLLGALGTGVTPLTGTVVIDYTTNPPTVTGSLDLGAAGLLTAQTFTALSVVQSGAALDGTPIYTLSGASALTNLAVTFTGQDPTTATSSVNLLATGAPVASGTGSVVATIVCFAEGTLIRTTRGDVAVEHLAVGDVAVTSSGARSPIRWLGHRAIDCRRHPRPHEVQPVLVAAHAFGDNRPARDLRVSPGHALCVDVLGEVLIPAGALVNGSTIVQQDVDRVSYWHVELDAHDVILAENMPTESYLEMGNRGFFAEHGVVSMDASPDTALRTHADFCRPFHGDGALVEAVRARLAARAVGFGWHLAEPVRLGDLHLMVDGRRVDPVIRGLQARFQLPAAANEVWLVSHTAVPHQIGLGPDTRHLGAFVSRLVADDGFADPRVMGVDDERLCLGFHPVEDGVRRWTAGRARLPADLWAGLDGEVTLRVDLAGAPLPHWAAPGADVGHALAA